MRSGEETYRNVTGGRTPAQPTPPRQVPASRVRAPQGERVSATPATRAVVENPTESMRTYPFYSALHGAADWYSKTIADPFSSWIDKTLSRENIERKTAPAQIQVKAGPLTFDTRTYTGGLYHVGQAAAGLVASPGVAAEFVGMVPVGAERLAREAVRSPRSVPQYAAAGLAMQAEDLSRGFRENPARMTGELVGSSLVLHGTSKGAKTGGRYLGEGTGSSENPLTVLPAGRGYPT